MTIQEKAMEFFRRIAEQANRVGGGKVSIDSGLFLRLAAEEPETAVAVVTV